MEQHAFHRLCAAGGRVVLRVVRTTFLRLVSQLLCRDLGGLVPMSLRMCAISSIQHACVSNTGA